VTYINKNLCKIALILNGYAFKSNEYTNEGIRIIRITNVQKGKIQDTNPQFVSRSREKEFSNYLLKEDDLLISLTGNVGRVGLLTSEFLPAALNQRVGCIRIIDTNVVNINYLYQYMNTNYFERICIINSNGIAQLNLSTKWLENVPIPLPPLSEQIAIADILSQAESLIAKRKESIALLDAYLKSTFLEMFGDPVRNEKGWEVGSLINFGSFKNGLNYNRSESGFQVRTLGVGDFKNESKITNIEALSILNLSMKPPEDYLLKNGDLIFVRSNGNRELVGRCIVIYPHKKEVTFSGFCIRYRPSTNLIDTTFLAHLFRVPSFKAIMLQNGRGANISNINQKILEDLKIPLPPLELQNQFAAVVEKVEALKEKYQRSLVELENLYGSLSQRAFRGELGLGG
jgi:type I restriction enzyme S subunit